MKDEFSKRFFRVDGREFHVHSGTWRCELKEPVDESGIDRRTFYLRFFLVEPNARWKGATAKERNLELRTSKAVFHLKNGYADWLALVIVGFLESDKAEDMIEAYEIERG
jgi:hypothetical protein